MRKSSHKLSKSSCFSKLSKLEDTKQPAWAEVQLRRGEYDEIEHQLRQDGSLLEYVKDKILCIAFLTARGTS